MSNRDELLKKLKHMPVEELSRYESTSRFVERSSAVLGVSLILLAMFYPTVSMILVGSLLTILLANIATGAAELRKEVQGYLAIKDK